MLVATPVIGFERHGTPRVISEIRKREPISPLPHIRPKISGDLLVICAHEKRWWPRRVAVLGGQLHISTGPGEASPATLRIPLRQLSLRAGSLPNSLALCKGQNVLLTLQTASEEAFDLWAKTLAIELIRQTPLVLVKYLDILTLADGSRRRDCCTPDVQPEADANVNVLHQVVLRKQISRDLFDAKEQYDINGNLRPEGNEEACRDEERDAPDGRLPQHIPLEAVEQILKKCQTSEHYVPVREKLVLFESLSRLGRKVRSSEDVSFGLKATDAKRHRSMHDLTDCVTGTAVREICKYFEKKSLGARDEQD